MDIEGRSYLLITRGSYNYIRVRACSSKGVSIDNRCLYFKSGITKLIILTSATYWIFFLGVHI